MFNLATACLTVLTATTLLTGNLGYADQEIPQQMSHTTITMTQDKHVPDNETPEQAVTRYRKGAEKRDAQSMNNLGSCYQSGDGVAKDIGQAVYWYRKSAELGYSMAMNNLGVCYLKGIGIEKDTVQAMALFTKAAEDEVPVAYYNMAHCYLHGIGVKQNTQQALRWFHRAVEHNVTSAKSYLAMCYEYGIGTEKNIPRPFTGTNRLPSTVIPWLRKLSSD